jgi:hypothetical protein
MEEEEEVEVEVDLSEEEEEEEVEEEEYSQEEIEMDIKEEEIGGEVVGQRDSTNPIYQLLIVAPDDEIMRFVLQIHKFSKRNPNRYTWVQMKQLWLHNLSGII